MNRHDDPDSQERRTSNRFGALVIAVLAVSLATLAVLIILYH